MIQNGMMFERTKFVPVIYNATDLSSIVHKKLETFFLLQEYKMDKFK